MKKIKLCFMTGTLEPGGTENQIFLLCKYVDRTKFFPVLVSLRGGPMKENFESVGVPVIIIGKRFKFDIVAFLRIFLCLLRIKPDILQTFMFTSNTWGRIAGIFSGMPVMVASERSTDLWKKNHHFFIDKFLGFFTDKIVCNSESVKSHYEKKLGQISRKLIVIKNGIDLERFSFDNSKPVQKKEKIVLTVSRISPEKGIQFLIEAAKIVLKKTKDVKFLIAGKGPLRKELEDLVKKHKIQDRVIFSGYIKNIENLISESDVVILPSLWEGLPNILLEAMAMKKPIIATDVGGVREIVKNGENGFIVKPACAREIAKRIIDVLTDEKNSLRMGENGYRFVKGNFDVKKMVSSYQCLYTELIARKRHSQKNKNVRNMRDCKQK